VKAAASAVRAIRRRHRERAGGAGHERWLVSYADFITLLFAFFTTMYAISTVDARKLGEVVDSMQAAFANGDVPAPARKGGGPGGGGTNLTPGPDVVPPRPRVVAASGPEVTLTDMRTRLAGSLAHQVADGSVSLEMDPRGLVISLREAGAFATGSAELSLTARAVLAQVAQSLAQVGNGVRIEGHTDDVPIHTARYRSNWELSTERATNVVALLIGAGVHARRLSASGYGEYHPRVPNTDAVSRARNRRVDIVILNRETARREEPAAP
jgi:chemotaxis protein MotB